MISKARDDETERYLRRQLLRNGISPIGVIADDPAIADAWLKGDPLDPSGCQDALRRIVMDLERLELSSGTAQSKLVARDDAMARR